MVTRSAFTKPRLPDYSDIEPLPDPPTRPDMEQFDVIKDSTAALDPDSGAGTATWFRAAATCEAIPRTWATLYRTS